MNQEMDVMKSIPMKKVVIWKILYYYPKTCFDVNLHALERESTQNNGVVVEYGSWRERSATKTASIVATAGNYQYWY